MDIKNLVTEDDTEALDAEISALRDAIAERNLFSNSETEELEALIAKSMVLGELYERKQWQEAQAQAVPEGFVLVPTKNVKFFSHDFNGDGFQYHDTLKEAKKSAEADLDIYRDRVADGNHIADMGEFNELAYGIVMGQAEWSVDCIVSADDHKNGEYTEYGIGTEILSLYLSEAQEQSHD